MSWVNRMGLQVGLVVGLVLITLFFTLGTTSDPAHTLADTRQVTRGDLLVRSVYQGKIEARNQVTVASRFKGFATVVALTKEGAQVRAGDELARFDSADLERELLKLEEEYALALAERESLVNAVIPLEVGELEMELQKFSEAVTAERQYLRDSIELAAENIVSTMEVDQQRAKVAQLDAERDRVEERLALNRQYLHPSRLQRADAKLHAARAALELAREQLANTTVHAPAGGLLVYKPLHIGGEYRTLRVGDALHANQPFMVIPDMEDLVLRGRIPESELARVKPGQKVVMFPQAFPDVQLQGIVEAVGAIAESAPGQPEWQKFFSVMISIDNEDARLRPGMSATAHVISAQRDDVLRVPRRAVTWRDGQAFTQLKQALNVQERPVTLGVADDTHYEVLSGLDLHDTVILQ
jgi:HlyD family secretion protein